MPLQIGKTPIVVPRQHQYNEHVNDHQVEFARNVAQRMGTIIPVEDINTLGDVRHIMIHSLNELYRLQKSKYVQSSTDKAYKELQTLLKNGEEVLFSGTPCQVEAAKSIANRTGGRLYTIDIICHGVPSRVPDFDWKKSV